MTPAGIFADRFGVWLALGLMALGTAVFGALTGLLGLGLVAGSQMWISLLVVRSIMGGLNAPLHPSSARTVANWIPTSQRGTANGLAVSAAALGIASTYYVFGALIDWVDWPAAFLITGGVTACLGILWVALAGDSPTARRVSPATTQKTERGQTSSDWSRLIRKPGLALLTLSYAAVNYFEYLFFYWMLYYFGSVLGLGSDTSRLYSTIVGLAMAAGMLSGGFITDRLERIMGHRRGRVAVPITGMITGAIMLGVGVLAKDPIWVVLWFSLALGSVTAAEAAFWTTAIELGGRKGTTAAGNTQHRWECGRDGCTGRDAVGGHSVRLAVGSGARCVGRGSRCVAVEVDRPGARISVLAGSGRKRARPATSSSPRVVCQGPKAPSALGARKRPGMLRPSPTIGTGPDSQGCRVWDTVLL